MKMTDTPLHWPTESPVALPADCARFIERVAMLGLSDWIRIGRTSMRKSDAAKLARLEMEILERGDGLTAWSIRDELASLAFAVLQRRPALSKSQSREFAAARAALDLEALKTLARA